MRDNQPLPFALPEHAVLALDGPDAARFAHAQFMNDVAALPDGHWHWSGWLTPKGRVVALFALVRVDAAAIRLIVADVDPDALADALRGFVFRSKVTVSHRSDLHVIGRFSPPSQASGPRASIDASTELDMGTRDTVRNLVIADFAADFRPDATAAWKVFDLEHGLPRLSPSQAGQWTPQQLSLDRLRAYSVKKGCYPGQEIVARTHFLGQAKRGLSLFDSRATIGAGSEVRAGDAVIGTIVSTAADGDHHVALAVLPMECAVVGLHANGIPLRSRAILDGLAR